MVLLLSVNRKASSVRSGTKPGNPFRPSSIYLMAGVLVLGLIVRLLPALYTIVGSNVIFNDPDSYYHMRRIVYTVIHYPFSNVYDSYVNFPHGFQVGWPPLLDLISATFSLIIGLGHPSRFIIEIASSLTPVIMGLVSIVLVYYITRDTINDKVALLAALIMALLPAAVFKTMFGVVNHHALEVLLSLTMYILFIRGASHAREESLNISNILKRRKSLFYAGLAGLATACMVFSWDGAPIYITIIGAYAFIQYVYDAINGESSEYLTIIGIISFIIALVIVAPFAATSVSGQNFVFSAMYLSWFHIVFLLGITLFFLVMGLMSKLFKDLKLPWYTLPATAVVLFVASVEVLKTGMPQFFEEIVGSLLYITVQVDIVKTISEAEPLLISNGRLSLVVPWAYFSVVGIAAILGLIIYLINFISGRKLKNYDVFFIVWTAIVLAMTLIEKRYIYLLAVNVSIFAGYLIYEVLTLAGLEQYLATDITTKKVSKSRSASMTPSLIGVIAIIILLLIPVLLSSVALAMTPDYYSYDWNDASIWLNSHSPKTSDTYDADQGTMPEYGIMSWWDYGNYILYRAERPAIANNFQTGIYDASHFFIAQDEASANNILNACKAKYVMVDYHMGSPYAGVPYGIFEDIPYLAGDDPNTYHTIVTMTNGSKSYAGDDKYFNTQYFRLYNEDGCGQWNNSIPPQNGLSHYRLEYITSHYDPVKVFEYVKGATILGNATPGSNVELKLKISSPFGNKTYYQFTTANSDGKYTFIVPYPTSDSSYMIKTGPSYNITTGTVTKQVELPLNAVEDGDTIDV